MESKAAAAHGPHVHLLSWNVDGIRAKIRNEALCGPLLRDKYDIVCLQETKACEAQVKLPLQLAAAFPHRAWSENDGSSQRKGLSGTSIWSRQPFVRVLPSPEQLREGRICAVEFPTFVAVSVYVPNSGRNQRAYRTGAWDALFCRFLQRLRRYKSTVLCGDFNVCHEDHDIHNPAKSKNRIAGFLNLERQQFRRYLQLGYVDAFRSLHPREAGAFTWWSMRSPGMRQQNKGWRLDYVLVGDTWGNAKVLAGASAGASAEAEAAADLDLALPPLQSFCRPYDPRSKQAVRNIRSFFTRAAATEAAASEEAEGPVPVPLPVPLPVPAAAKDPKKRGAPDPTTSVAADRGDAHPVLTCVHHADVYGSDHCPVSVRLRVPT
jgi:exodeoxyribonuclease-3